MICILLFMKCIHKESLKRALFKLHIGISPLERQQFTPQNTNAQIQEDCSTLHHVEKGKKKALIVFATMSFKRNLPLIYIPKYPKKKKELAPDLTSYVFHDSKRKFVVSEVTQKAVIPLITSRLQ